jgi:hypothetical protein
MNYSERVSDTWRHGAPGASPKDYRELVRYATLAASSHNTQPWIFQLEPNRISVLPDLSRRCPGADQKDLVADYVARGNEAQFADPAWARQRVGFPDVRHRSAMVISFIELSCLRYRRWCPFPGVWLEMVSSHPTFHSLNLAKLPLPGRLASIRHECYP